MGVKKAVLCGYGPNLADALGNALTGKGIEVESVTRLDPTTSLTRSADVVLCALSNESSKSHKSLLEAIQVLRISRESLPILCTSVGDDVEFVVQAVKAGANDYQRLSPDEVAVPKRLLDWVDACLSGGPVLAAAAPEGNGFHGILGRSLEIRRIFDMIRKVGATSSTILLSGESGTGKELVCRAIHKLSDRAIGPLIPVNCGAIPEELLESELFGHEKGAFTGATTAREGRFQMAHNGTIFLDEVGEMSPKLQVKLLRVLQENEFERVGGSRTIRVNVRIVAATNRDLEKAVYANAFREDLYYRLNVIPIVLPPLRERKEDIPLLIESFINRFREKGLTSLARVHPDAMAALQAYPWPGNVRELENLIERMAILLEGTELRREDLPERFRGEDGVPGGDGGRAAEVDIPEEGIDLKSVVDDFENQLIEKALERSGGVKNRAAQLLGLNRTTLVEKMKKKKRGGVKAG